MHQIQSDEVRRSLLMLLRPLVKLNFILGTCPCLISKEGQILTPYKYFNFARFFLVMMCFLVISISSIIRAILIVIQSCDSDSNSLDKNIIEDSGGGLKVFADIVCGFYANLVPGVFLCMASCRRRDILIFIESMVKYINGITGFGDYAYIKNRIRRLYIMHGVCGVTISVMITIRYLSNPLFGQGQMVFWLMDKETMNPNLLYWMFVFLFCFLSVAKTAVTVFIEVCCISLAACFCRVIENIQSYLDDVMSNWSFRFLEFPLNSIPFNKTSPTDPSPAPLKPGDKNFEKNCKIQKEFENYLEQIRRYNHCEFPPSALFPGKFDCASPCGRRDFTNLQEMTPGQQIIFVVDKFQTVRSMQQAANGLFGHVLALNTGLMIFLIVLIKYMLIWTFGLLMERGKDQVGNGNFTEILKSQSSQQPGVAMLLKANTPLEWTVFAIMAAIFMTRLTCLVICLGNVHYTSLRFNSKLSQALLQAQKVADVVEMQGVGNKYFGERSVITVSEANIAVAFITENTSNPMAFSAAGLFCYSRHLILVIFSIITTYLVFLLQV